MPEDRAEKQTIPRFWLFVILILGSVILGDLNQRMTDARGLEKDLEFLLTRAGQLDDEIEYFDEQIEYVSSDDFIQDWAHEQAKMVEPDEVLVILVPSEGYVDVQAPSSGSEPASASGLDVWLELIFGR
jgi:cell division protein FtsB